MKSWQMPMTFFNEVIQLAIKLDQVTELADSETLSEAKRLAKSLENQINEKVEKKITREIFTKYKTAERSTSEREALRREYLERRNFNPDWISNTEHDRA